MFGLSEAIKVKVEKEASNFYKMLKRAVHLRKEHVLVISDYGIGDRQLSSVVAYGYYLAARKNGLHVTCLFQEPKKEFMFLEPHVLKALEMLEKNSVVLVAVAESVGRFSQVHNLESFCKRQGHRFLLTTGLAHISFDHFTLLLESMFVNPEKLRKQGTALKKRLDKAKELRLKTDAGTDLVINIEGKNAHLNAGEYLEKGEGGSIPTGCVGMRFSDAAAMSGTVVLDGSITTDASSVLLDEPLTLKIEDGKVVSWEGKHAALFEEMFERLDERGYDLDKLRVVQGIAVGINPRSLLVGSRSLDPLVLGTAYLELCVSGRQGTLPLFLPQVFKDPQISLDGEKVKLAK